jgi:hypothetical protein
MVGDSVFPNSVFTTSVKQQLGVATNTEDAGSLCKFCGTVRDFYGIHDQSCTCGGDINIRHNEVRDLIHGFAQRGQCRPVLERVGLLAEPGVLLDMRRPADVLIEQALSNSPDTSAYARLALDVKVINSLGTSHIDATRADPLVAMEAYHDKALAHQQTEARCRHQGITYVPMVFTAQGGMAKRAEAVLHQIAEKMAKAEGKSHAKAFGEMVECISGCLAKHRAQATLRRSGRRPLAGPSPGPAESLLVAARREDDGAGDSEDDIAS